MITQISEIIHKWTGWCPNANTMKIRNFGNPGGDFHAGTPLAKTPVPSGTDRSGMPRGGRYDHTQRGTLIIGAVGAAAVFLLASALWFGLNWIPLIVLGILLFVLAIMSTLTVRVDKENLRIRFGPVGLVRKSWPVSEITLVKTVTNSWYYGWGIRVTPYGPLYNVSGYEAVEVQLFSGKAFRIGTDEPEALKTAIEKARTENKTHTQNWEDQ